MLPSDDRSLDLRGARYTHGAGRQNGQTVDEREELGTWTPAQAEVLVRALERAGIRVETAVKGARRQVTVPASDAPRASRVMQDAMDDIAAAADRAPARAPRWYEMDDDEEGQPLLMERLRSWGGWLVVLVSALMVAIYVPGPTWFRIVVIALVVAAIGLAAMRKGGDDDREYGPDA